MARYIVSMGKLTKKQLEEMLVQDVEFLYLVYREWEDYDYPTTNKYSARKVRCKIQKALHHYSSYKGERPEPLMSKRFLNYNGLMGVAFSLRQQIIRALPSRVLRHINPNT